MSLDEQERRALAYLAARCRPAKAKRWDEPGIVAALGRVPALPAGEIIIATIRAAMNPKVDSPGVIPVMNGEHWRERQPSATTQREVPVRERCNDCGKPEHAPIHPTDHPFERARRTEGNTSAEVAHLRGLIRTAPKENLP